MAHRPPSGTARPTQVTPEPPPGREREDLLLRRLLHGLQLGRPALVDVHGPPGIGRSALLDHVITLADSYGVRVVAAHASREEIDLPHGIATQLHSALAATHRNPAAPPRPVGHPPSIRAATLAHALFAAARAQPLLLVVDDVQWADRPSLRGLQALARRLQGAPLMVLTSRNTAVPCAPYDRIEPCPLADERTVAQHTLFLTPLPDDIAAQVVAKNRRTPEAFAAQVARCTEGNPALLRAVANRYALRDQPALVPGGDPIDETADAVRDHTARTLAVLPGELLDVLAVIAVAGPDCTPDMITALSGTRTIGVARALALLAGTGLLVPGPLPAFRSEAAAEAVLAPLTTRHRRELYARAAEWAQRAAFPDRAVARMLLGARTIGAAWAVDVLHRRAARCRATGRPVEAARLLERALGEPVPPALRVQLLTDLSEAVLPHAPHVAGRHLRRALLVPAAESGPARLRAAELLIARGDVVTAGPLIHRAVLDARADTPERAALYALQGICRYLGPPAVDLPLASDPAPRHERPAEAGLAAWRTALHGRDAALARRLARAALAPAAHEEVPLTVRTAAAHALLLTGRAHEARSALDEVIARAEHGNSRAVIGLALIVSAFAELQRGKDTLASRTLDRCEETMPRNCWHPLIVPAVLALRTLILLRRGEHGPAQRILTFELPNTAEGGLAWALLLYARGRVQLETGHREPALADLLECGRLLLARKMANPALLRWRSAAARACAPDDPRAARLRAEERMLALAWGTPDTMAATLLATAGPTTAAPSRASWQYRQALVALGTAPRFGHHTVDSLLHSDQAALPSAPPRTPALRRPAPSKGAPLAGGSAALSAAERKVAHLAADGHGNRAIAAELSVSTRAVELHLTKTYRKLGIQGRPQLAAALGRTPREKT
ncbi:AAA family ATPase [Streptomyces sp. NPDC059256]|uniref:AAA family ATPase n=1 Tax=Streptomyces sp. NPDC059256 TaxID=3346794 RepID=UPI0036818ACB